MKKYLRDMTTEKNLIVFKTTTMVAVALCLISLLAACSGNSGSGSKTSADKTSVSSDDKSLLGAGSTFVYPLFSKLFYVYDQKTGVRINYQSIGSGGGILQLKNKTVDFGDSDAPLSDEQTKGMGAEVLHVPMCSGAVVISYNIPGITDTLKLTPDVLADIYLGKVTKWNDAKIKNLNPTVQLPAMNIAVAHRSDGSGTTNIFTDYLSKISPDWKSKVGKGTAVNWPAGLGGKGNEGVAGLIKQTPGGIGYIELAYAIQNKMLFAQIQNKSGNFVTPTIASTSAAGNVQMPADSKVSLTNTDAPDGYPISGFTWALLYKEQSYSSRSKNRAENLVNLLWWNIHEGQNYCAGLYYAPLSKEATAIAENILKSATYKGTPILTAGANSK